VISGKKSGVTATLQRVGCATWQWHWHCVNVDVS